MVVVECRGGTHHVEGAVILLVEVIVRLEDVDVTGGLHRSHLLLHLHVGATVFAGEHLHDNGNQ